MGIWGDDKSLLRESTRVKKDSIDIVLSAYRSMLHPVAYVSMAITSGKLCYDVLDSRGVKSLDELKEVDPDAIYRDIIQPNISHGISLAERIAKKTELPVIAPAVFEAKKHRWGQKEYMFMWYRVIEEKVQEIYMMDGWEYSDGASQEFVRAMEMQFGFVNPYNGMVFFPNYDDFKKEKKELEKRFSPVFKALKKADGEYVKAIRQIGSSVKPEESVSLYVEADYKFRKKFRKMAGSQRLKDYSEELTKLHEKYNLSSDNERMKNVTVYNEEFKELRIDEGSFMIAGAIKDLRRRGFESKTLFTSLHKLLSVGAYYHDYLTERDYKPPYDYDFKKMKEMFKEIRNEQ